MVMKMCYFTKDIFSAFFKLRNNNIFASRSAVRKFTKNIADIFVKLLHIPCLKMLLDINVRVLIPIYSNYSAELLNIKLSEIHFQLNIPFCNSNVILLALTFILLSLQESLPPNICQPYVTSLRNKCK